MERNLNRLLTLLFIIAGSLGATAQTGNTLDVKLGGAFRFNWQYTDWNQASKDQRSAIFYDVTRLNMKASYGKIEGAAEYRLYPESAGGGMLKYGWIAYNLNDKNQIRFGMTSVPLGILPYQSNNFFCNLNYFIGLEDDDDVGITYQYTGEKIQVNAAFFKNSDLLDGEGDSTNTRRFSYDITGRTKETNTAVLRFVYKGGNEFKYEIGASGYVGQAYNIDSHIMNLRYAYAGHAVFDWNRFNFKGQYTEYNYSNEESKNTGYIKMGAFGLPYYVCDRGRTYSACLAYSVPIKSNTIDGINLYNDYSYLEKLHDGFNDSQQNVLGACLSAGPVIMYLEWVYAKNHSWIGPEFNNSFAEGPDNGWHSRVNLNVGFYF